MNIPVKVRYDKVFDVAVSLLNPILKLKPSEKKTVSLLLNLQYLNKNKGRDYLEKKLFSTGVRKLIRIKLNISEASLNNQISSLRRRKVIIGNSLNPIFDEILKNLDNNKFTVNYSVDVNRE